MTNALLPGENFAVPSQWPTGTWGQKNTGQFAGVVVANLHWQADPKKRLDPNWFKDNTAGFSEKQVAREFNLDWTIADGKPVFPDYNKEKHSATSTLRALPGLPVYVGWDFGLNPAAAFVQPDDMGQVRVLRCLNEENKALPVFGAMVIRQMLALNAEAGFDGWTWEKMQVRFRVRWQAASKNAQDVTAASMARLEAEVWKDVYQEVFAQGLEFIHVGDPAGKSRSANDAKSGYQTLQERFGITVRGNQKHQVWDTRRTAVTDWLVAGEVAPGQAKFTLSADESCERLRAGFEGLYAYDEAADTGGREMPKKDRFSHPQDALQYVACYLAPANTSKPLGMAVSQNYAPQSGSAMVSDRFARLETGKAEAVSQAHADDMATWEPDAPAPVKPAPPQKWNPFLQSQMG